MSGYDDYLLNEADKHLSHECSICEDKGFVVIAFKKSGGFDKLIAEEDFSFMDDKYSFYELEICEDCDCGEKSSVFLDYQERLSEEEDKFNQI